MGKDLENSQALVLWASPLAAVSGCHPWLVKSEFQSRPWVMPMTLTLAWL